MRRKFGEADPDPEAIDELVAARYEEGEDGDLASALIEYLDGYERFATGINPALSINERPKVLLSLA